MTYPHVPERLETERLVIRPPEVEDIPELYEAVIASLDRLKPWMVWATKDMSLEDVEKSTRKAVAQFVTREDLRYHFHAKDDGRFLVGSGLHRIDWTVPKFEIGYWCRAAETGKGYVTEGVTALTEMAFEQLGAARVEIRCDSANERSVQVAERCGFELEAVLKNDSRSVTGALRSTCVYALTR